MDSSSISTNLRAAYARARVRIISSTKEPQWIAAEVIVPILTVSAYVFMYKVLGATNELSGYIIVGGTMIAFWANTLWNMSAQFYWEKETGLLEMYFLAPISRMSILLGMALGGAFNTTLRALVILLSGSFIFQVPLALNNPAAIVTIFILTLTAIYALGMLFASLFMLYGREAWQTASLLQEPIYFFSGFYFPVLGNIYFPLILQALSSLIPMTLGLDGIRRVLIGGAGFEGVALHILGLIASVAILFPTSRKALSYMEKLGKQEGRLTLRWQ